MTVKLATTVTLAALALLGLVATGADARAQGGEPPVRGQQMTAASVSGLAWVPGGPTGIPTEAMVAGVDNGRPAYVCRVDNDGLRVGKLLADVCLVPMSGAEIGFPDYEVLTGSPWLLRWPAGTGMRPNRGLVAGEVSGQPGVLCVVEHMGGVHPGMVLHDRCHFGLDGKEIMAVDYRFAEPTPPGEVSMRYAAGGWVPPGALTVAEGAPTPQIVGAAPPLCLAQSGGAWVPGMLEPGQGCVYAAGSQVERATGYTVVVGDPGRAAWVTYEGGELPRWEGPPEYSVRIGGYRPGGPPLEICRAEVGGDLVAGHVEQGRCLMVVAGGTQVAAVPRYQVLHYIHDMQQANQPDVIPAQPDGLR